MSTCWIPTEMRTTSIATATYLETNTWIFSLGNFKIVLDPVLQTPLDFGVPYLYTGQKKFVNGPEELRKICQNSYDYVLISQGFDDHAHVPTLKQLFLKLPSLYYIAPPSAMQYLISSGIPQSYLYTLSPGASITLTKAEDVLEIKATSGALLGPPWQSPENGYIINLRSNGNLITSLYCEPHCMYKEEELSQFQVDNVITPVVSQQLPFYTLVAGGEKARRLSQILKAKRVLPMANGELNQSGFLSRIIQTRGSREEFCTQVQRSNSGLRVVDVVPGEPVSLLS
jgi:L-ascorbate metabolism protein UlaG (beta-lactamase superfamily)